MKTINGSDVKKILGLAGTVVAAVSAFTGVFAERKKDQEFEELKKTVADLQKKISND